MFPKTFILHIVLEIDTYSSVCPKENQLVYIILWKGDCRYFILSQEIHIFNSTFRKVFVCANVGQ